MLSPADLANPLPLVKAQLNEVFEQAQIQINRDRAALPVGTAATIAALPELLRNSFSCILLAIAFATLARRNNARFSLQDQQQIQIAAHAGVAAAVGPEDPHHQELRLALPLLLGPAARFPQHISVRGETGPFMTTGLHRWFGLIEIPQGPIQPVDRSICHGPRAWL